MILMNLDMRMWSKMPLNKTQRDKAWEALNGKEPLSMIEVRNMEKNMDINDSKTFHNLMYGKEQKNPKEVYDLLERNTSFGCSGGKEWVPGFYKKDGTFVSGFCRKRRR